MKLICSKYRNRGFTVPDLVIVLVTVVLLVFLYPRMMFHRSRVSCRRTRCVSNLKQVGLAFRLWSGDHGEKFPMTVPNHQGGTSEFLKSNEVFQLFLVMSNEVNTPTILACPMDTVRKRSTDFAFFSNNNLSYFVGLDADECVPQSILSGDRNISTNGRFMSGVLTLTTNPPVRWTRDLHHQTGNIGLGDGSAQQVTDAAFMRQMTSVTNLSARLAIP